VLPHGHVWRFHPGVRKAKHDEDATSYYAPSNAAARVHVCVSFWNVGTNKWARRDNDNHSWRYCTRILRADGCSIGAISDGVIIGAIGRAICAIFRALWYLFAAILRLVLWPVIWLLDHCLPRARGEREAHSPPPPTFAPNPKFPPPIYFPRVEADGTVDKTRYI
jgi:hypothetical protein